LTEIPLADYSEKMNSEFSSLVEKVNLLAEQSHSLRRENAALRGELAGLTARMNEAHDRIATLIRTMPVSDANQETA
jgi:predicted nuclease with TOPRIM domain